MQYNTIHFNTIYSVISYKNTQHNEPEQDVVPVSMGKVNGYRRTDISRLMGAARAFLKVVAADMNECHLGETEASESVWPLTWTCTQKTAAKILHQCGRVHQGDNFGWDQTASNASREQQRVGFISCGEQLVRLFEGATASQEGVFQVGEARYWRGIAKRRWRRLL